MALASAGFRSRAAPLLPLALASAGFSSHGAFALAESTPLVTPKQLLATTGSPPKFLDCSWHLPGVDRDAQAEFEAKRLPGAQRFDMDAVADTTVDLPHMLPSPEAFGAACTRMGISMDDEVVCYSHAGCFSAPRVWWTFKCFGHDNVRVLDGGLPAWEADGGPTEIGPAVVPAPNAGTPAYRATFKPELVADWKRVLAAVEGGTTKIVDSRPHARYAALVEEPRPGLEAGHIPTSSNLPFGELTVPGDSTTLKSPEELRALFDEAGIDPRSPLLATCGSGVTASLLSLCLQVAFPDAPITPVYDGSWSEWGKRADLPKAK